MAEPIKITLLGQSGVGKTSIFSRICAREPPVGPTVGVEFATVFVREFELRVQIWDTAGMERFAPVTDVCLRNSAAILLVYAVDDTRSFDALATRWLPFVEKERATRVARHALQPLVFVVGNKNDLTGGAHLTACDTERAWAHTIGAVHVTTTTTAASSINMLFVDTVCHALAQIPSMRRHTTQMAHEDLSLSIFADDDRREKSGHCC